MPTAEQTITAASAATAAADKFDLQATLDSAGVAFQAVTCHIFFDAALHGLVIAAIIGIVGAVLWSRKHKYGRPFVMVCKKLAIACCIMATPGIISLALSHQLPPTGAFHINSLGFILFWSWICLHLSAEEMNFEWF
jgi:hypothetical protein